MIGAGAAGLAAAKALRAAGVETLLLETTDHSGGRCVTDHDTFDVPFDRGGSWLHSAPINPLARAAEAKGATLHKRPWSWARVQALGHDLTPSEITDYNAYQRTMWQAIDARGAIDPDTSNAAALPPGPWQRTASMQVAQMSGGDADVASARDSTLYANAPGDWLVGGGLGTLIQTLHADVPVTLSCPVTRIDTRGAGVRISTPLGEIAADQVILTVSTGVLAAGHITFDPPLPASKRDAIDGLPNGLLNKVGIVFDPRWQGAAAYDVADYHSEGEAFCSLHFGFFDTSLAVGFVAGRFAAALEREGKGAATDFCLAALVSLYGSDARKHVLKTDETAWRSDPATLGSYSYARPGQTDARQVLAEPLHDRLYFAGEATMRHTYSTVHGAVESGQRAAAEVIATRTKGQ